MAIVLFEDSQWHHFLPLVYTRPVGDLRCGILTQSERWSMIMKDAVHHETREYLRELFPPATNSNYQINARLLPAENIIAAIQELGNDETLTTQDIVLAQRGNGQHIKSFQGEVKMLCTPPDIFSNSETCTRFDFAMLTKGKVSGAVHESVTIIGDTSQLFLEEGAVVTASIINTKSGPVYLGKDSEVMEGCMIRGPFSLGEHAQLKMGTKIYGSSNVGPHCKVAGEISNSVFWGYSNKAHDGFVGNSVLGQWCNLGADTNTSNLKNNYGKVKTWSVQQEQYIDTGLTFCGLLMGDHSKCGINTMFNTGTVTGVCANIFGGGFPEKWIPSFSWGGPQGMVKYRLEEALETAAAVMGRRNLPLTEADRSLLTHLHHNAR